MAVFPSHSTNLNLNLQGETSMQNDFFGPKESKLKTSSKEKNNIKIPATVIKKKVMKL